MPEIEIEKLVYGGDGLARLDGQVLLTPFVLPGELVEVNPVHAGSGLLRAPEAHVLTASPERSVARCEYFKRCGGCHYQHALYASQLEFKRAILAETLRRTGGIELPSDTRILAGEPWGYRNRVQLHFVAGAMGFHRASTNQLQPIDHCPISSPRLNEVMAAIAEAVKRPEWPRFLRTLEVFTNEVETQIHVTDSSRPVARRFFDWCATFIPGYISGALTYRTAGFPFRISRSSFFQVNRFLADDLVREVTEGERGKTAWDLYAGVGLFTRSLATSFSEVAAVERGAAAFRDLTANLDGTSAQLNEGSAEAFLKGQDGKPDLVVADPPRAGLGTETVKELIRIRARSLTIVSCDPATLARDLKVLVGSAYRLRSLTLIDLFPQTYHLETVAKLVSVEGGQD